MTQSFKISGIGFELNNLKSLLIITLLCFGVYGNTIFNDYNIDDPVVVTNNKYVQKGISGVPDIVTHPYQDVYGKLSDYRPIAEITLAIEYQFFGLNPHVSHLVNILLYCLLCCLIYQLLVYFKLNEPYPYLPLLITCFFVVHAAHTEVVASIKNREELLAMIFGIASLLFAFKFYTDENRKFLNLLGITICIILAVISKLSAVPFIAIIILMGYQFGPPMPLKIAALFFSLILFGLFARLLLGIPYIIGLAGIPLVGIYLYKGRRDMLFNALLIYVLITCAFYYLDFQRQLGSRDAIDLENPLIHNHQFWPTIALALDTLWFYFKFMLVPFPFRFYYGAGSIPLHELTDGVLVISLLIHTALFAYGLYTLRRRQLIGFIIICYFISIGSYCNLIAKYTGLVSERALFIPSLWFIAAMLVMLFGIFKKAGGKKVIPTVPKYAWLVLIGLFFFYSTLTIYRNLQWKNYLTLASSDIDHLQNSTLANLDYAVLLKKAGEKEHNDTLKKQYLDKAKFYYYHTIKLSPKYAFPYLGLGEIYRYDEGKTDSGCNYFYTAYLFDSTLIEAQFQIARCAFDKRIYPDARHILSNLYARTPQDTAVLYYYAKVLYVTGDQTEARKINQVLYQMNPSASYYYVNEGYFDNMAGNRSAAAANFENAIHNGCRDNDVLNFMFNYYLSTGQSDKANGMQGYFSKKK